MNKVKILLVSALLLLGVCLSTQAQVPTASPILTFTSPVRLWPTNTNSMLWNTWSTVWNDVGVEVGSAGSTSYLTLALRGKTDPSDMSTNITITRSYYATNGTPLYPNYRNITETNIYTNEIGSPNGGFFVFRMNPATKTLISQLPVFSDTGKSGYEGGGAGNITNAVGYGYRTFRIVTNTEVQTRTESVWTGTTNTNVSIVTTNKHISTDWSLRNDRIIFTTNNGTSWSPLLSFSASSSTNGYINCDGVGVREMSNNFLGVISRSGTNFIVNVYRISQ